MHPMKLHITGTLNVTFSHFSPYLPNSRCMIRETVTNKRRSNLYLTCGTQGEKKEGIEIGNQWLGWVWVVNV